MEQNGNLTIGLVGAGGDGVVLLGTLIQHLGAKAGYQGQMRKFYDAQIRGGGSAVKLSLNAASPALPGDVLDILVCFAWSEFVKFRKELATSATTLILCETEPPAEAAVLGLVKTIPLTQWSKDLTNDARNKNVIALGIIAELVGFDPLFIQETGAADRKFAVVLAAPQAEARGRDVARELSRPDLLLPAPASATPMTVLCGNEAVVEGAVATGCNACFFYPITPATEISEMLGRRFVGGKGAYWQAEDELAAVLGGYGASLAGAKALVATSGPGLSLMIEAIGLGVGDEIPLVIVDVQRGGPSTGVPTMTEQSDLNLALYGGHGDCPRVVLAPFDIESADRLTREAFNIAEGYQVTTIVLSDQLLGQTYVALDGEFLSRDYPVVNRLKPDPNATAPYQRFADTPNHISPMANYGDPYGVYQTSGLSHREDGTYSPAHAVVQAWHDKLENKLTPLSYRDDLVRVYGNENAPDRIITWGSSAQAVLAAVKSLGRSDQIAVCVPELIAPLPEAVKWFAGQAERLMIVELNHAGQFASYLRSQLTLPNGLYSHHRSGAQPFSVEEIAKIIELYFYPKKEVES